jgi:hypothetical protein
MTADEPRALQAPPEPRPHRRALSHVGGKVDVELGEPALARLLERALDVRVSEERVLADLHGFHSYPARMHPDTARTLVEGLSRRGDTVLDPFCGSGTILVEAQRLERIPLGSDLNPIAVELASLKTARLGAVFMRSLESAASEVAEHARERQLGKLGPTVPYGPEDRELYASHVLLELDGLRSGIDALGDPGMQRALRIVLSAILTKVSIKAGDATQRRAPKRLARGYTIRLFTQKAHDLAVRALEARAKTPRGAHKAQVELADARDLRFVEPRSVSLIVSSPPYPGVYDYFDHHRLRLRWLRLDGRALSRNEIGARRAAKRGPTSVGEWERDFTRCLEEFRRVLRRDAKAVLLVADSSLSGRALRVEEWMPRLAARAKLSVVARASQRRPHFHEGSARAFGSSPRREHLIVLQSA